MATVVTGKSFGVALCDHLGLDKSMVAAGYKMHTGENEILGVTLTIALEARDIEAIGKLMASQ